MEPRRERRQTVQTSSEIIYSVLAARVYDYEVVKQTKVIPKSNEFICFFSEEAQMYAVELQPGFMH